MRLIDADAFERAVMFSDDEDLQDVIYRLRDFPTIEQEPKIASTDDLIIRADAMEAIRKRIFQIGYEDNPHVLSIQQAVVDVPAIEVERKKGKWVDVTRHEHYPSGKPYGQLQCPFCKRFDHNGDGNFCGYCGEDMRGSTNDEK